MANALLITLIGMGLVFIVILLLWGLMALLVRLTAEKEAVVAPESEALAIEVETPQPTAAPDLDRKRRAAAAAVAVALALQSSSRPAVKPAGSLSAWQIVHRAGQGRQRTR